MKRDEVLRILQDRRQDLEQRYGIAALFLFGSTARDTADTRSDVDLLVDFNRSIGLFQFIELKQELEALLGCEVDLGTRRSLKPYLKDDILQEAIRVARADR